MSTKVINIKKFRQNMTQIWQENLAKDIAVARLNAEEGKLFSESEVYEELGL